MTVSVGVATRTCDLLGADDLDQLFSDADRDMYDRRTRRRAGNRSRPVAIPAGGLGE